MRKLLILLPLLALPGCIAKTAWNVATLPVKAVGQTAPQQQKVRRGTVGGGGLHPRQVARADVTGKPPGCIRRRHRLD